MLNWEMHFIRLESEWPLDIVESELFTCHIVGERRYAPGEVTDQCHPPEFRRPVESVQFLEHGSPPGLRRVGDGALLGLGLFQLLYDGNGFVVLLVEEDSVRLVLAPFADQPPRRLAEETKHIRLENCLRWSPGGISHSQAVEDEQERWNGQ